MNRAPVLQPAWLCLKAQVNPHETVPCEELLNQNLDASLDRSQTLQNLVRVAGSTTLADIFFSICCSSVTLKDGLNVKNLLHGLNQGCPTDGPQATCSPQKVAQLTALVEPRWGHVVQGGGYHPSTQYSDVGAEAACTQCAEVLGVGEAVATWGPAAGTRAAPQVMQPSAA